ncbi:MAG: site-specific integrase [Actinomycetota bacterium]|nr:site-specific integrase [Actinomycetota bacterium]
MSVHRHRDRWQVHWRQHGRQRARTFDRKRDAQAWDAEIKRRAQLGPLAVEQLTEPGLTLGEWIVERWTPEHGVTLEASTRRRYAEVYELHLAPWLDDVAIRDVTVARLRAWQAERVQAGVSAGTLAKARTFLSSVLRHAAESEAIPGNPLTLVRAPRAEHSDAVVALAPVTVEAIRAVLLSPAKVQVPAGMRSGRPRRSYEREGHRSRRHRQRDAAMVSVLAYAGLRPGELRGLRWEDVRDNTILVQRGAQADGGAKATKTRARRAVRLLAPLAADLKAWRLASGRPPESAPAFPRDDGRAWTKEDWGNWRGRQWTEACAAAGLATAPRPYDLRHSFASLLLAEHRTLHYVAAQLGHSPALTLSTYGHVMAEYADAERIDAEAEIARARGEACSLRVRQTTV